MYCFDTTTTTNGTSRVRRRAFYFLMCDFVCDDDFVSLYVSECDVSVLFDCLMVCWCVCVMCVCDVMIDVKFGIFFEISCATRIC